MESSLAGGLLGSAVSQVFGRALGHGYYSVSLVTQRICQKQLPPITASIGQSDIDFSDSSCHGLLPPHVCFDLFLSSTVTVKDEEPRDGPALCHGNHQHKHQLLVPAWSSVHWPQPLSELYVGAGKEQAQ